MPFLPILLAFLPFLPKATATPPETFSESLSIRQTQDGKLITHFAFTTDLTLDSFPSYHPPNGNNNNARDTAFYTLFPSSLGEILRKDAITEMHMSLNSGKWDYARWGYEEGVGTGGEVRSWIADLGGGEDSVDERWNSLQNSLGGLFCASISPKRDVSSSSSSRKKHISYPSLTYPPEGLLRSIPIPSSLTNSSSSSSPPHHHHHQTHHLRLSLLPSERLCTENLTPFLKLLPCTSHAGLASLLNPHALVSADWHGISVHFTQTPLGVRLALEVRTVFDPVRSGVEGRADWTLENLFNRKLHRTCPAASSSHIHLLLPSSAHEVLGAPLSGAISDEQPDDKEQEGARVRVIDLLKLDTESKAKTGGEMGEVKVNIGLRYPESHFDHVHALTSLSTHPSPSPLLITRTLLNHPTTKLQTRKLLRVEIEIENPNAETVEVVYTEFVPWFVGFYVGSLEVRGMDPPLLKSYTPSPHPPLSLSALSAEGDLRPSTHLSFLLSIPPGRNGSGNPKKVQLQMEIELHFLKYTGFVPDAQRGVEIPGAVFRVLSPSDLPSNLNGSTGSTSNAHAHGRTTRIHTTPLLLTLPTPDFSMPYNVIVMTSTVIAFVGANTFNLLVRKGVWVRVRDPK